MVCLDSLRSVWLCLLVVPANPLAGWWIANTFLMGWRSGVLASQATEGDRKWITDHDGGLLIPIFEDML